MNTQYAADIEAILAQRTANGADLWATPDNRIMKGSPFTTQNSPLLLLELGMPPDEPVLQQAADLIFSCQKPDGRFKIAPQGGIYPCHTIHCLATLCRLGHGADPRLQATFAHLFAIQHTDGGWRCNKFSFGRGPETEFSNPGPTLTALEAFRHTDYRNNSEALDKAVEFLLQHWVTKKPLGPCHYGIGSLFVQPQYPFGDYNIFGYLYTLSFYKKAAEDSRFLEALSVLETHLQAGQLVPRRVNPKLRHFAFCKKGQPSPLATKRYREIVENIRT